MRKKTAYQSVFRLQLNKSKKKPKVHLWFYFYAQQHPCQLVFNEAINCSFIIKKSRRHSFHAYSKRCNLALAFTH